MGAGWLGPPPPRPAGKEIKGVIFLPLLETLISI